MEPRLVLFLPSHRDHSRRENCTVRLCWQERTNDATEARSFATLDQAEPVRATKPRFVLVCYVYPIQNTVNWMYGRIERFSRVLASEENNPDLLQILED